MVRATGSGSSKSRYKSTMLEDGEWIAVDHIIQRCTAQGICRVDEIMWTIAGEEKFRPGEQHLKKRAAEKFHIDLHVPGREYDDAQRLAMKTFMREPSSKRIPRTHMQYELHQRGFPWVPFNTLDKWYRSLDRAESEELSARSTASSGGSLLNGQAAGEDCFNDVPFAQHDQALIKSHEPMVLPSLPCISPEEYQHNSTGDYSWYAASEFNATQSSDASSFFQIIEDFDPGPMNGDHSVYSGSIPSDSGSLDSRYVKCPVATMHTTDSDDARQSQQLSTIDADLNGRCNQISSLSDPHVPELTDEDKTKFPSLCPTTVDDHSGSSLFTLLTDAYETLQKRHIREHALRHDQLGVNEESWKCYATAYDLIWKAAESMPLRWGEFDRFMHEANQAVQRQSVCLIVHTLRICAVPFHNQAAHAERRRLLLHLERQAGAFLAPDHPLTQLFSHLASFDQMSTAYLHEAAKHLDAEAAKNAAFFCRDFEFELCELHIELTRHDSEMLSQSLSYSERMRSCTSSAPPTATYDNLEHNLRASRWFYRIKLAQGELEEAVTGLLMLHEEYQPLWYKKPAFRECFVYSELAEVFTRLGFSYDKEYLRSAKYWSEVAAQQSGSQWGDSSPSTLQRVVKEAALHDLVDSMEKMDIAKK